MISIMQIESMRFIVIASDTKRNSLSLPVDRRLLASNQRGLRRFYQLLDAFALFKVKHFSFRDAFGSGRSGQNSAVRLNETDRPLPVKGFISPIHMLAM